MAYDTNHHIVKPRKKFTDILEGVVEYPFGLKAPRVSIQ